MKKFSAIALAGTMALSLGVSPAFAEAGGCLKYGAAGAVGGHLAGHGVVGAMAGCATGMAVRHHARQKAREQQYQQDNATMQGATTPETTTTR
jgi:hypothetical protein